MADTEATSAIRQLITDDILRVRAHPFRVRIWKQKNMSTIVLTSQLPGSLPPDYASSNLANQTLRAFLGLQMPMPNFFESSLKEGIARVARVRFEVIGHELRPILYNPKFRLVSVVDFALSMKKSCDLDDLF